MKILVIGNGFDLEHGLPTKYKDFLDFMIGIKLLCSKLGIIDKKSFIEELERITKHDIDENIKESLTQKKFIDSDLMKEWKEEELSKQLIEGANNNIWIKYFLENMNYEKEGWIDFESEISSVIQCIEYMRNSSEYYQKYSQQPRNIDNYKEKIVRQIISYSKLNIRSFELSGNKLQEVADILNKHLNELILCLEIYLDEFVNRMGINLISYDIKDIKFDKVLSFNYTNTYERICTPSNREIEYHYIHGKADASRNSSENNIVLGIEEYLDIQGKNERLEFVYFKKYFQRIYKQTGSQYKKWLRFMNEPATAQNDIYIFGHSLDITDMDIFKELFDCKNTAITILYHNKYVFAQQIVKLIKIIGQDELIKRVSGAEPTIIFKQQSKKVERN